MVKFNHDFSSRFRILKGGKISLIVSAFLAGLSVSAIAAPTGGVVTSGSAIISQSGTTTNITQTTSKATINWQNFSIASNETVNFNQPNVNSITLNRVIGNERSIIDGALNANGQVWILNSNGILFNSNAKINTAGILATTKNITDADFQAGNYTFSGESTQSIINLGTIESSDSGYVAMLANTVSNDGTIKAYKGTVHLTGASEATINLNGNSIVSLTVNKGVFDALVENKNIIQADGGKVYLTTNAVDELLRGVVNNTGIIEAQSLEDVSSEVILFAHGGTATISGTIDATGGFVETSGKELGIENGTTIKAKTWLIDPENVTIDGSTDALGGATVGASVIETALSSGGGNTDVIITADNDITVNEALDWSANKLTLSAGNNIAINADMTATGTGSLALYYGQATADGGTSRYTVADGVDVLIPNASAFTWKKGSSGAVTNLVLDNGYLRFGNGTEASINAMASLLQPWYYDNVTSGRNGWYQLTFDTYPLDFMIGVNGSGYNGGSLYDTATVSLNSAVSNLSINIGRYFEKTGTVTASMDVATSAGTLPVTQSYTLDSGTNFVKATTSITNNTGSAIANARLWIGTQDDYVADMDVNYKTRGNIGESGFTTVEDQTSGSAKALIVSESPLDSDNGAAVLFYSTTDGTNAIVGEGFGWDYITNANPASMANYSQSPADGSYALYLNLGTFPDQATGSVTWYYAAAPVSEIANAVNQVGQSSGVTPSTPTAPEPEPTPEPTPEPVDNPQPTEVEKQIEQIVTSIVNTQQTKVEMPKLSLDLQLAPKVMMEAPKNQLVITAPKVDGSSTPATQMMTQIAQKLQVAEGESVSLISAPIQGEETQKVTMTELQVLMTPELQNGDTANTTNMEVKETRVSLGDGSLVELVNGGVTLPEGVDQEFYVVRTDVNKSKGKK